MRKSEDSLIDYKLAELNISNITHTFMGGYNATTYSSNLDVFETIRGTGIKGMWRWWFRAYLGGAIWKKLGAFEGSEVENYIKSKTQALLGSKERGISSVLLRVIPLKSNTFTSEFEKDIPRIKLLARKLKKDELKLYNPSGLNFKLKILRNPFKNKLEKYEINSLIGSLLTSLIFQGIGGITRRGFGSLLIEGFEGYGLEDYKEVLTIINSSNSAKEIEKAINKLIETTFTSFENLVEKQSFKEPTLKSVLPPFPIVVPNNSNIFRIAVKEVFSDGGEIGLLNKIGNAFMKSKWKSILKYHQKGRDYSSPSTFILGLPRMGIHRGKRETYYSGYWILLDNREEAGRRISAISIRVLKRIKDREWLCLIYGMLSKDWPNKLIRRSVKYTREGGKLIPIQSDIDEIIQINEELLREKFEEAFNVIIRGIS